MERQGVVSADDPVTRYLPDGLDNPALEPITLRHLATHTSGLPRLPKNLDAAVQDDRNPYAHYEERHLLDALRTVRPKSPGSVCVYSNFAMGLLGYLLGRAAGGGYEEALRRYLLEPLGMSDSGVALDSERQGRLAQPHDPKGRPTPPWDTPTLAGAGAVRATAGDLLRFLEANLGEAPEGLREALAECHVPRPMHRSLVGPAAHAAAVTLPLLSLGLQWAAPIPPGRPGFLFALLLPPFLAGWIGRWPHWLVATALSVAGSSWLWGPRFSETYGLIFAAVVGFYLYTWRWAPRKVLPRMGWQGGIRVGPHEALWHNGRTGGSASLCAFVPERGTAVAILTNSSTSVDHLGTELIRKL
jgi:CubicO group peptidase (beta-lactamase class C family)